MTNRIRLLAGSVTLAGAAVLATASPAYSTMARALIDPLGTTYCCAGDTNGDGVKDSYCCYPSGCYIGPGGCQRRT
jgi:hypothetical protein